MSERIDPHSVFTLSLKNEGENFLEILIDNENASQHLGGELYFEMSDYSEVLGAVWLDTKDVQAIVDTLTFWLKQQEILDNTK